MGGVGGVGGGQRERMDVAQPFLSVSIFLSLPLATPIPPPFRSSLSLLGRLRLVYSDFLLIFVIHVLRENGAYVQLSLCLFLWASTFYCCLDSSFIPPSFPSLSPFLLPSC